MTKNGSANGLSTSAVEASRRKHGNNTIESPEERVFLHVAREIVLEPMFILLVAACLIYFFVGHNQEGFIMLVAVFIVAGISLFQEYRSRNAILALKRIAASKASVIRNGSQVNIPVEDIVYGDTLLLKEGEIVSADGLLLSANDFAVNESILTGESFPVSKTADEQNSVYKGTLVTSGSATVQVTAVGNATEFGKIGQSLKEITIMKTPLQLQIRSFVKNMVWIGGIAFLLVIGYNYYQSADLVESFLQGLTLAMSILPEEIPVAFSTFQALGAFRLLRSNIVVKQPQYVETLGSATVICTDKTGTLTENRMSIVYLYDAATDTSIHFDETQKLPDRLIEYAMWASETMPFDPMEKAIHELYENSTVTDKRSMARQVHEYPIGGKPPMMTHIFTIGNGETIIAAKGAPEAIIRQSHLPDELANRVTAQSMAYANEGYRVLGVGQAHWDGKDYPASQHDFVFEFSGLLAFQDPPKANMAATIKTFNEAGIAVKMITGDYAGTALAIARQIHLPHDTEVLTGDEVLGLPDDALQEKVRHVDIYARMYPEAKLKVINALKANGEIVAMTGDGVNDGPALKAAHIGIAMGRRGSEVAKAAASLVLVDDDLSNMTEAVAQGRKIYDNLKKAIQYIVSIHIPIILIVALPLLLMWTFTDIFSPVHVIFLELIMGPTCSIIYENEPMEAGTMKRPPRDMANTFLSGRQLLISIIQGLAITAGCLGIGYYYLNDNHSEEMVRSVIFITLLFSNIFLTLVNRSFRQSVFTTIRYKNNLVPLIIFVTLLCAAAFLYVPFVQELFRLTPLHLPEIFACAAVAFCCTFWLEVWKAARKR